MFKKLLHRYNASEFLKNTAKLASATTIVQLISVATAPILYRIYEKEHYGTLGLYMAITGVLGVFSSLQYTQTILIEKEDNDALTALWLNRVLNIAFAALSFIIILIFHTKLYGWANNALINKWLWLIPISIFFSGQNEFYRVWANRKKEYSILTVNAILTGILVPAISISLGFIYKSELGLFIGLLSSQIIPAVILFLSLKKKYTLHVPVSYPILKAMAIKHISFPKFSLTSEFVNRFTSQLPVFMLNKFAGPASVGVYNLCSRMLGLPVQFIGGAISTVYQQASTEEYHRLGNCSNIFIKTFKSLLLISIVPTLLILIFGPQLFSFFFGAKWIEAGVYARILILMFSLQLIVSPLTYIYFIKNNLKEDFFFHLGILITLLLGYWVGLKLFEVKVALIFHSIGYSIWYFLYLLKSYQYSKYTFINKPH